MPLTGDLCAIITPGRQARRKRAPVAPDKTDEGGQERACVAGPRRAHHVGELAELERAKGGPRTKWRRQENRWQVGAR